MCLSPINNKLSYAERVSRFLFCGVNMWPACEAVSYLYISIKPVHTYTLTLANAEELTWVLTETFPSSLYLVFFASLKRLWQHAVVLICLRDVNPPLHFLCSLFQEEAFSFLGLSCIYLSCWCYLRTAFPSSMFSFIALFFFIDMWPSQHIHYKCDLKNMMLDIKQNIKHLIWAQH